MPSARVHPFLQKKNHMRSPSPVNERCCFCDGIVAPRNLVDHQMKCLEKNIKIESDIINAITETTKLNYDMAYKITKMARWRCTEICDSMILGKENRCEKCGTHICGNCLIKLTCESQDTQECPKIRSKSYCLSCFGHFSVTHSPRGIELCASKLRRRCQALENDFEEMEDEYQTRITELLQIEEEYQTRITEISLDLISVENRVSELENINRELRTTISSLRNSDTIEF